MRFPCLLRLRHQGCGAEHRGGEPGDCSFWEWRSTKPQGEDQPSRCLGVSAQTGAVNPACVGDSCGLGTRFSRNTALNGHNHCCCAASSPRDLVGGHTLAITRSFALPPPQMLNSLLSSLTSPVQSALGSSARGLHVPAPPSFFCKKLLIWEQMAWKGSHGGSAKAYLPLLSAAQCVVCILPAPPLCLPSIDVSALPLEMHLRSQEGKSCSGSRSWVQARSASSLWWWLVFTS